MFVATLLLSAVAAYVVYDWATRCIPWLGKRRRAFAFVLAAGCLLPGPMGWLVAREHLRLANAVQAPFSAILLTAMLAAIPLAAVSLGMRARAKWGPQPPPSERDRTMDRRRVIETIAGAALLGGTGSMMGWGIVRGRHAFELSEVPVRIPGLPRALDGYTIVQVSDIHTGVFVGDREFREGLELVRRARPDLFVVTGDVVDFEPELAGFAARRLVDVGARDGVVAVLGNHDYYAGAQGVARDLGAAGIDVLVNRGRVLRPRDGGGFALLGVDDLAAPRYGAPGPRLDYALATVPSPLPRILLSHQPPTVDLWAGQVALQLSGHTHGGQINPGRMLVNPLFEYLAGSYFVRGTTLYVNRGFGTVGPPARVGSPPEVTRIVLVAA